MAKKDRISRNGMKLVHAATGEWLRVGHIASDIHRQAHVIQGGEPPNDVFTNRGTFAPPVVNCAWREMSQSEQEVSSAPNVAFN